MRLERFQNELAMGSARHRFRAKPAALLLQIRANGMWEIVCVSRSSHDVKLQPRTIRLSVQVRVPENEMPQLMHQD